MNSNLMVIAGMALVTYLPRILPFYLFSKMNLSKRMMLFLKCIPYTALGALILPDVFSAVEGNNAASLIGAVTAVVLTYMFKNMIVTVIGAIAAVYVVLILI
jgi:branched-subunit amino acid transport protein